MDVAIVRWPAEADRLEQLRAERHPRLVIVEQGPPPVTADALEDWLRAPADESELRVRVGTLRERAAGRWATVSLEDRVLRAGNRVVVLPPIQARLAGALLERKNAVVSRETLSKRAWPAGAPEGRNVLDVHMAKLRRVLAGTVVDIRTVHRRGYLMQVLDPDEARGSP